MLLSNLFWMQANKIIKKKHDNNIKWKKEDENGSENY